MSKALKIQHDPNYYITDTGDAYSRNPYNNPTGRIKKLKLRHDTNGYVSVTLSGQRSYRVHRLVAEAFIPNPENKPEVNHIDGNKQNNNVSNLEWCSHSENNIHAYRVLGKKSHLEGKLGKNNPFSKRVLQIKDGKIIAEFYGTGEASRQTNIGQDSICRCCNGKRKTAGGFQWTYKDNNDKI